MVAIFINGDRKAIEPKLRDLYSGSDPYLLHDLISLNPSFPHPKVGITVLPISLAALK